MLEVTTDTWRGDARTNDILLCLFWLSEHILSLNSELNSDIWARVWEV
jgi:hypothetical protein